MNYNRLGNIGRSWTNRILRGTYPGTLIAKWTTTPETIGGEYDEATGKYVDPTTRLPIVVALEEHEIQIPAYFDDSRDAQFRYVKYGVNIQNDLVAIIPDDTVLPSSVAKYYRLGNPIPHKLNQFIDRADIGIANGLPQTAYKVLHLTRGDVD